MSEENIDKDIIALSDEDKITLAELIESQAKRSGVEPLISIIYKMNQIGITLWEVLRRSRNIVIPVFDSSRVASSCDYLHITDVYSDSYIVDTMDIIAKCDPLYVIIHSVVPPGTIDRLRELGVNYRVRDNFAHMPIVIHPPYLTAYMSDGLHVVSCQRTISDTISEYFKLSGINIILEETALNTEWGSLLYVLRKTYHWKFMDIVDSIESTSRALYKYPVEKVKFYNGFTKAININLLHSGDHSFIENSYDRTEEITYAQLRSVINIFKKLPKTDALKKHLLSIKDIEKTIEEHNARSRS